MSIVGFQDFWVAGSRFYYQRDPLAGVKQPWIDLGVVQPVNPSLEIEKLELTDSDGGVKSTVDERVVKIEESYDITCSNLNMDNLSLLFLADPPEAFSQSAVVKDVAHDVIKDRLFKLHDSDTAKTLLYDIDAISGLYKGAVTTTADVTSIVAATKKITVTGVDPTAEADLGDGKLVIIQNDGSMSDPKNARTYTITAGSQTSNTFDVDEAPNSDESGITSTLIFTNGGTIYKQGMDWSGHGNVSRGFVRLIEGGAIASGGTDTIQAVFSLGALSGARLIKPQGFKGEIKGAGLIFWGRGNFAEQSVRESRISITPSSANVQIDDFSNFVISVKVISDLQATDVAGRLIYFQGALPTTS